MKSDAQYGSAKLQPGSNQNPYQYDPEKAQQEAERAAMPQRLADALRACFVELEVIAEMWPKSSPQRAAALNGARATLAAYAAMKEDTQ